MRRKIRNLILILATIVLCTGCKTKTTFELSSPDKPEQKEVIVMIDGEVVEHYLVENVLIENIEVEDVITYDDVTTYW